MQGHTYAFGPKHAMRERVKNIKKIHVSCSKHIYIVTLPRSRLRMWWASLCVLSNTRNAILYNSHRRRIELEDKAKVITSDWGTESLPR